MPFFFPDFPLYSPEIAYEKEQVSQKVTPCQEAWLRRKNRDSVDSVVYFLNDFSLYTLTKLDRVRRLCCQRREVCLRPPQRVYSLYPWRAARGRQGALQFKSSASPDTR